MLLLKKTFEPVDPHLGPDVVKSSPRTLTASCRSELTCNSTASTQYFDAYDNSDPDFSATELPAELAPADASEERVLRRIETDPVRLLWFGLDLSHISAACME